MFKALRRSELNESVYFTCTIGTISKKTNAHWHVSSPADIIRLMTDLAFGSQGFSTN
jgi:trehalose 6-phosphate synthase/phosphatase